MTAAPSAIQARDLARKFGAVEAVRGLSLDVQRGEIYGLVGPDAAGKTTTIRMLAGLIARDAGTVAVLGRDPVRDGARVRESLGLMPQQYSLYGDLSIAENLRFFGRLFCLPRATYEARAARLLALTRLAPFAARRADALSGGMYKKLALSCALLHQPAVLLLDEPTNGVDPVSRRELWELLYEFVGEGMAVLVSTPYMDEAERCHRVGLMHRGRLLCEGPPGDLVRGFDHAAFEVHGGDRAVLEPALLARPEVRAVSLAGTFPRVVLRPDDAPVLANVLAALDARLVRAEANFEDLFLTRVGSES